MKPKNILTAVFSVVLASAPNVFAAKAGGGGGGAAGGGSSSGRSPSAEHGSMSGGNNGAGSRPASPDHPGDLVPAKPAAGEHAARSAAPDAQDLSNAMKSINQTTFSQRKELLDTVDLRLQSSRDSLKQIQADAKASRADARADFKKALVEVKARDSDLNAALKASRKADEAAWGSRRSDLAKANQNYAEAMARLEAARRLP